MLDLPQPLGPTTAVIGSGNVSDRPVDERLEPVDLQPLDLHGTVPRPSRGADRCDNTCMASSRHDHLGNTRSPRDCKAVHGERGNSRAGLPRMASSRPRRVCYLPRQWIRAFLKISSRSWQRWGRRGRRGPGLRWRHGGPAPHGAGRSTPPTIPASQRVAAAPTVELDEPAAARSRQANARRLPPPIPGAAPGARPDAQILPFPRARPPRPMSPIDKPTLPSVPGRASATPAPWLPGWPGPAPAGSAASGRCSPVASRSTPAWSRRWRRCCSPPTSACAPAQKLLEDVRRSLGSKELGRHRARSGPSCAGAAGRSSAWTPRRCDFDRAKPFVLLVIGVNGSGKTTTIGKLAAQLRAQGKTCCWPRATPSGPPPPSSWRSGAAGWACAVVRGKEGADPSSVIFEPSSGARAQGIDVVIGDTAGRLHTKADLMQELEKVRRVVAKAAAGRAPRDLAGDRRHQRPERHRPGADLHPGDGGHAASCSPSSTAPPRAA